MNLQFTFKLKNKKQCINFLKSTVAVNQVAFIYVAFKWNMMVGICKKEYVKYLAKDKLWHKIEIEIHNQIYFWSYLVKQISTNQMVSAGVK